jgi:2-keto-3-deoxy-L-arabinonate dehydratase
MPHTVHGLVPILATPFLPDGALDRPGLRRLTEFQLKSGATGVGVFGMASEGFALTSNERSQILTDVIGVIGGAIPIVAGIAATSTTTAIEQAQQAEAGGASALMVLPPFMTKPSQSQIIDFYGAVAAAVTPDVMVQDAPGATGVTMSVSLIAELSALAGVSSVKVESPPTAPKIGAVFAAVDADSFAVLGGQNSQFVLEEYARGAVGTMPACEFTDQLAPVLADWNAGRTEEAHLGFSRLLPLVIFGLQGGIAWAVHKHVLVRRGIIEYDVVRSPAGLLDDGSRRALDLILKRLALPPAQP